MPENTPENALYTAADREAINGQIRNRWLLVGAICALLLAGVVASFILRVEVVTTICTVLIGALLIFCWDLFIKPLWCYRKHINGVMNGLTHKVVLPFIALSEDVNMVDGVACRALTCQDTDAKGRPYERLFYLDALKTIPEFTEGEMLCVIHHDLLIANVYRA